MKIRSSSSLLLLKNLTRNTHTHTT